MASSFIYLIRWHIFTFIINYFFLSSFPSHYRELRRTLNPLLDKVIADAIVASEKKAAEAAIEAERAFAEAAVLEAEAAKQKLLQVRRIGHCI